MDELINKIISIEEQAQSCIAKAKEQAQNMEEQVQKETRALEKEIRKKAETKCATLKQYEDGEADKKIEEIVSQTETRKAELERKYEQNKEAWVNLIFQNVING